MKNNKQNKAINFAILTSFALAIFSFLAAIGGFVGTIATAIISRYEFWMHGYAEISDILASIPNLWLINHPYASLIDTARQLWIAQNLPHLALLSDAFGWLILIGILAGIFFIAIATFLSGKESGRTTINVTYS